LKRELHEELGIDIGAVQPWKIELMDYPHARVRLHFCKVRAWHGEFQMRERQQMAWQSLPCRLRRCCRARCGVAVFAQERGVSGRDASRGLSTPLHCRPWPPGIGSTT